MNTYEFYQDNSSGIYYFLTSNEVVYEVWFFKSSGYSKREYDFGHDIYSFGFGVFGAKSNSGVDVKIKSTIQEIIIHWTSNNNKILSFIISDVDSKLHKRIAYFTRWYDMYRLNQNNTIEFSSFNTNLHVLDDGVSVMGFLYRKDYRWRNNFEEHVHEFVKEAERNK